jgi:hypothetical protein
MHDQDQHQERRVQLRCRAARDDHRTAATGPGVRRGAERGAVGERPPLPEARAHGDHRHEAARAVGHAGARDASSPGHRAAVREPAPRGPADDEGRGGAVAGYPTRRGTEGREWCGGGEAMGRPETTHFADQIDGPRQIRPSPGPNRSPGEFRFSKPTQQSGVRSDPARLNALAVWCADNYTSMCLIW